MGLASALSTALTGLAGAETTIDVVGNNLANASTVGFKASEAQFATQFLQTQGLGSAPTGYSGGTNPRQTGLGVQVAEITPDFTQGTIEVSANPSDLAIQGDGFFIVQGQSGENLYSRNGILKTNSQNELVTITGNRLLGYGVDKNFQIESTTLVPLTIPLGAAAVAQATQNVYLEGTLTPTGDIANTAGIIQSAILSDGQYEHPSVTPDYAIAPPPDVVTTAGATAAGGPFTAGEIYNYRFAWADEHGTESPASGAVPVTVAAGGGHIDLSNLPSLPLAGNPGADYPYLRIYRTAAGGSEYRLLTQVAAGTAAYSDSTASPLPGAVLNEATVTGNYSYYVTYYRAGQQESRPSALIGPQNVTNGRIQLTNIPAPPAGGNYDSIRVYRNLANNDATFYLVDTVTPNPAETTLTYTDSASDAVIATHQGIDLDGPKINTNTLLTDVTRREGSVYQHPFEVGTLDFTGTKGGRRLGTKEFTIGASTTIQDLVDFMGNSMGIQEVPGPDPANPIPQDGTTGLNPGGAVTTDGRLRFVSNNGRDNAVDVGLSSFQLTAATGQSTPTLSFSSTQTAVGESAITDFVVYDSLGIPLNVRLTAVLQDRNSTSTVYRWFADSSDNDPVSGSDIAVGTGLVTFDGEGNFVAVSDNTVSIDREHVPSAKPLEFDLDFTQISGLAAKNSSLAASRQDGSSAGILTSFIIGEDGRIRGVFNNGVTQDLGQIRLARFGNNTGLEQRGENLFAAGVNSGLPVQGNPGDRGIGTVIAGAVELSNTDMGGNLIDLILASTQYRGNTRVITTAQQLLDELLNLRR
ncbi:MAG: flagellar hook-basal body complex protein [Pirellulales bacterium]